MILVFSFSWFEVQELDKDIQPYHPIFFLNKNNDKLIYTPYLPFDLRIYTTQTP